MSLKTGIIALGIGVGGYAVAQGVPSIQSGDGEDQTRDSMIGGIPQQAQGQPRGFGVPNTTNITKKSVSVREGDTNITENITVKNAEPSKKESEDSGSSSSGSTHIIQDEQSGGVIRDASPDDGSDTKKGHDNVVSV